MLHAAKWYWQARSWPSSRKGEEVHRLAMNHMGARTKGAVAVVAVALDEEQPKACAAGQPEHDRADDDRCAQSDARAQRRRVRWVMDASGVMRAPLDSLTCVVLRSGIACTRSHESSLSGQTRTHSSELAHRSQSVK